MTDLEMTRLCAEAIGLVEDWDTATFRDNGTFWFKNNLYNPLHDDTQAMALVKKFGLDCQQNDDCTWGVKNWRGEEPKSNHCGINTDLNRAIVECVAKMQAACQS